MDPHTSSPGLPPSAGHPPFTVAHVARDPLSSGESATLELARTFVASPYFAGLTEARAVFRPGVGLVVMGPLTEDDLERLAAYEHETAEARSRLDILSYPQVEELAEALAGHLTETLGPELEKASFTSIPRGGLVTLGILSYFLDLRPQQLGPPWDEDAAVVVVDDCALSGLRFKEWLRSLPGQSRVVFAPLLSHPELRRRILVAEDRVQAVVSARDLVDRAPSLLEHEYGAWQRRWESRELDGYWVGIPDHVVFPWNEPDVSVWDPKRGTTVCGWRVADPDHCLKNRISFGRSEGRLYVCEPSGAGFVPGPGVVYADLDGVLAVADVESGRTVRFDGSAAALWLALADHDGVEAAAAALAEEIDLAPAALRQELTAFGERAVELGLMSFLP